MIGTFDFSTQSLLPAGGQLSVDIQARVLLYSSGGSFVQATVLAPQELYVLFPLLIAQGHLCTYEVLLAFTRYPSEAFSGCLLPYLQKQPSTQDIDLFTIPNLQMWTRRMYFLLQDAKAQGSKAWEKQMAPLQRVVANVNKNRLPNFQLRVRSVYSTAYMLTHESTRNHLHALIAPAPQETLYQVR